MAHLVTSAQQTDHVTSANAAHFTAGSLTPGNYVLPVRGRMAVALVDANTVRISGGDAVCCGRHWEVEGDFEDVTIDNGTPGLKRIDLIVARIWTVPDENMEIAVIKGQETEGDPEVPNCENGDLLDGDTLVEVPICSVSIDGIVPASPVRLLEDLRTMDVPEGADSASVGGSGAQGGNVEVSVTTDGRKASLNATEGGILSFGAGGDQKWSLPVGNVAQQLRGSAIDLSYAALSALAPGFYLVPSTAANQPTSGQGDANMMVGRAASNRAWAILAYNTGAVYAAYGYTSGSNVANFKWQRIDNGDSMLIRRQRGAVGASAADPGDISFPKLYELGANPGTYLIFPNTVNNPSPGNHGNMFLARSAGGRIVCLVFSDSGAVYGVRGYGSQQSDGSYSVGTWAWVRIDVNGTGGILPISRGGTNASTVKGAVHSLFPVTQAVATQVAVLQSDGGYSGFLSFAELMMKMFPSSADGTNGAFPYIPTINASGSAGAYYSTDGLRKVLGITYGSDASDANNIRHWLYIGNVLIQWGYAQKGNQGAHGYYSYQSSLPKPYKDTHYTALVSPYWTGETNGDSLGWTSLDVNETQKQLLKYAAGNGTASTLGLWVYWMTLGYWK